MRDWVDVCLSSPYAHQRWQRRGHSSMAAGWMQSHGSVFHIKKKSLWQTTIQLWHLLLSRVLQGNSGFNVIALWNGLSTSSLFRNTEHMPGLSVFPKVWRHIPLKQSFVLSTEARLPVCESWLYYLMIEWFWERYLNPYLLHFYPVYSWDDNNIS